MKHPALKIFVASVCFLPLAILAGSPPAPTGVEVTTIDYTTNDIDTVVTSLIGLTSILIGLGAYKKWKKK